MSDVRALTLKLLSFLLLLTPSFALAAEALPRTLAGYALGATQDVYRAKGVSFTDGCPSCIDGEAYAFFDPSAPSAPMDSVVNTRRGAEIFLFKGKTYSISVGSSAELDGGRLPRTLADVKSSPLFARLRQPKRIRPDKEGIAYIQWEDQRTVLGIAYEAKTKLAVSVFLYDKSLQRERDKAANLAKDSDTQSQKSAL